MNSNAIRFAIEAHHSTNHLYDGKPYSVHLALVAYYAQKYIDIVPEHKRPAVYAAVWLHDTIEDCRLTYNDIRSFAGEEVAELVFAVSNEKGKTRKERANSKYYSGIRDVPYASFVKLCDRLANVRYSKDNASKKFKDYKEENSEFLRCLFPLHMDPGRYAPMIKELCELLD